MTKYGAYIQAVDRDAPPEWRGKFIAYKQLKKALKALQLQQAAPAGAGAEGARAAASDRSPATPSDATAAGAAAGAAAAAVSDAEARFFKLLKAELERINSCFVATAQRVVCGYQRAELRRRLACCWPGLLGAGPRRYADLAERAYWARKYARANAVALRKICKKHDKQRGTSSGRSFLQHCWRMPAGGAFLHSPLLDELKAIQDVLDLSRQQQEDLQLVEVADTSAKAKSQARQLARAGAAAAGATGAAAAAPPALQGPEDSAGDGGAGCTPDLPRLALRRDSCGASSSGAGAGASAAGLDRQGSAALAAILESPTCMLSSSDFEWEGGSARWAREARPPSLDLSPLRDGGAAAAAAPGGSSLFHPDDAADAPASPGGSLFQGKELECCICLETLYKPVGLACGHKFCKQCALEHAGLGRAVGTFANLCSYVRPGVACPQCRQRSVYGRALRMRQLDRVLKARHPQEWEERRQEERRRERAVLEQAAAGAPGAPSLQRFLAPINARDALLAM